MKRLWPALFVPMLLAACGTSPKVAEPESAKPQALPKAPEQVASLELPATFMLGNDVYGYSFSNTTLTVPASRGVLANDLSLPIGPLSATLVQPPQYGTVTLNPDGSFTYTRRSNYRGYDTFTYRVNGSETVARVQMILQPSMTGLLGDDAYTVSHDAALEVAAPGVLANDVGLSQYFASIQQGPQHGTLTLNRNGSFRYVPNEGFTGFDTFRYTALGSDQPATVVVRVEGDKPQSNADAYRTAYNTTLNVSAPGVLGNDTRPHNTYAEIVTHPQHGTLNLNPDGSFSYVPTNGFSGPDSFVYRAVNEFGASANTLVNLTVDPPPQPVAAPDTYSATSNRVLSISAPGVLSNDTLGQAATAQLMTLPQHGTVSLNSDGSFSYTPQPNFYGTDSFTYRAVTAGGESAPTTVTLNVGVPTPNVSGQFESLAFYARYPEFTFSYTLRGTNLDAVKSVAFPGTTVTDLQSNEDGSVLSFRLPTSYRPGGQSLITLTTLDNQTVNVDLQHHIQLVLPPLQNPFGSGWLKSTVDVNFWRTETIDYLEVNGQSISTPAPHDQLSVRLNAPGSDRLRLGNENFEFSFYGKNIIRP